jgi:hypothetical protein
VRECVVGDLDGEALHLRVGRQVLRHRPRLQDTPELEPEVVVQRAGVVALDHEPAGSR